MNPRHRPSADPLGRRLRHEQDGATAILTALALFVLLGAALIAVDAGSLWTARRSLITDVDAAALAAAAYFDAEPSQACTLGGQEQGATEATRLLAANNPDTSLEDITVEPVDCDRGAGKVAVTGRVPATLYFGPVFGLDAASAAATSLAEYGPLYAAEGLRPIGICKDNPHYQEYVTGTHDPTIPDSQHPNSDGSTYPGAQTPVHRVFFEKQHPGECGSAPGNWGWLDYNGSNPPNGKNALKDWIDGGYDGEVSLTPPDCNPELAGQQPCDSNTGGGGGSLDGALGTQACAPSIPTDDCDSFPITIYQSVDCTGGGTTCTYDHVAFVSVVLRGWGKITGNDQSKPACQNEPDPNSCPYFDLEFVDVLEQGSIGPVSTALPTVHGVELCGNDYAGDIADHCDF